MSAQAPGSGCRNWRIVGYQGAASCAGDQRQSASNRLSSQTGRPIAPARWATAVSTVMTRSRHATKAAVSAKSARSPATSVTFKRACGACMSAFASSVCSDTKLQPATSASGVSSLKGTDLRAWMILLIRSGLTPLDQHNPTRRPGRLRSLASQTATSSGKARRYGTSDGRSEGVLTPQAAGRLMIGHWNSHSGMSLPWSTTLRDVPDDPGKVRIRRINGAGTSNMMSPAS